MTTGKAPKRSATPDIDPFKGMKSPVFESGLQRKPRTRTSGIIPGIVQGHQVGNLQQKTQQVIVSQTGSADFKSIHEGIEYIKNTGGNVFIKNGDYNEKQDIIVPNNVSLIGETVGGVVISFGAADASIKMEGTEKYSTGTLSVTKGSNTLVGSGTTWSTNITTSHHIKIGKYIYEVAAVVSDTVLALKTKVFQETASGLSYFAAKFRRNVSLQNLILIAPLNKGVVMDHVDGFFLQNVVTANTILGSGFDVQTISRGAFNFCTADGGGGNGLTINDTTQVNFAFFVSTNNGNRGIEINDSDHCGFEFTTLNNNAATGFMATGINRIALRTPDIAGNGNHGIEFSANCNYNQIYSGSLEDNTSDGISLTATSDNNIVNGVVATGNGGYGVDIAAATCDKNIVTSNQLGGNTTGGLNDSGTSTTAANNILT